MKEKYLEDLKDIKEMMHKSSRFISLSGKAGIAAGMVALVGAIIAHQKVFSSLDIKGHQQLILPGNELTNLFIISVCTLLVAILVTIFFTTKHSRQQKEKIWDHQTSRLLINLLIPLSTGGILCILLIFKGYVSMVITMTLIFYGLALINASKYTLPEIRSLGLIEILLGLIAFQFINIALICWALGFGFMHIVYGIFMHLKYQS
ncbi:MAG: hypothetical protein HKN68_06750 [Saprospiraceae bacterium]|nr:hypothetical protein [Saprospiraceae bacterium]